MTASIPGVAAHQPADLTVAWIAAFGVFQGGRLLGFALCKGGAAGVASALP